MITENVRANLRRRAETLRIEIGVMESKDQRWKGRYHELVGELRAIEDTLGGNYD